MFSIVDIQTLPTFKYVLVDIMHCPSSTRCALRDACRMTNRGVFNKKCHNVLLCTTGQAPPMCLRAPDTSVAKHLSAVHRMWQAVCVLCTTGIGYRLCRFLKARSNYVSLVLKYCVAFGKAPKKRCQSPCGYVPNTSRVSSS